MTSDAEDAVAFYGGSFDPPHVSHVLAAAYVLATASVDSVLVVPTFDHPLGKRAGASFEHRVKMCEIAFADLARVEVSRIEGELGGQSRTVRTLETLTAKHPNKRFRLMIGADLLSELDRWYQRERIEALAPLLVVGRTGYDGAFDVQLPEISSTAIRERLRARGGADAWVPRDVLRYIGEHGLYDVTL